MERSMENECKTENPKMTTAYGADDVVDNDDNQQNERKMKYIYIYTY